MQVPLEITARNVRLNGSLEEVLRERTDALERFHPRLVRCHVTLDGPGTHHRHGGLFSVRLDIRVPGKEIVVSHQSAEELPVAIRDAFDAAKRQIHDFVERQRGETKVHEEPPEGTVNRLFADRGYGFLQTPDGREVYFHRNSVLGDFSAVKLGTRVRYAEEQGAEGPQASSITVLGD